MQGIGLWEGNRFNVRIQSVFWLKNHYVEHIKQMNRRENTEIKRLYVPDDIVKLLTIKCVLIDGL